jgi:hypothetical protein
VDSLDQGLKLKSNAGQFVSQKIMAGRTSYLAVGNVKCLALN